MKKMFDKQFGKYKVSIGKDDVSVCVGKKELFSFPPFMLRIQETRAIMRDSLKFYGCEIDHETVSSMASWVRKIADGEKPLGTYLHLLNVEE